MRTIIKILLVYEILLWLHLATKVSFLHHRDYFCSRASSTHTCSTARAFDVQGFAHAARKVDNQGISRREKRLTGLTFFFLLALAEYSRYFTELWEIGYRAKLIKHADLLFSRCDMCRRVNAICEPTIDPTMWRKCIHCYLLSVAFDVSKSQKTIMPFLVS